MKATSARKMFGGRIKSCRKYVCALLQGLLIISSLSCPSAFASREPSDSTLSGAWRWIRSFGGLLGANETPGASGFERILYFRPSGSYEYVEQDSAHEYLLCSGRVTIHRYPNAGIRSGDSLAWLALEGWWVSYERNMLVWFIGKDTLAAYPGSPTTGVEDALTHWFVRASASKIDTSPEAQKSRLPQSARPSRLDREPEIAEGEFVYYEEPPLPIRKVLPDYPISAREAGAQGTVLLHVLVGRDGYVKNVKVARGVTGLNEPALVAVKQWVFKPALSNKKAVAVWTEIAVDFPPHRNELRDQCRQAVDRLSPRWRFPNVSAEVRRWATVQKEDPTVAYGDFDDDGKEDIAMLVQSLGRLVSLKIVACLSSLGPTKPVVVEKPYCSDGIDTAQKGRRYYDYGTDREGTYPKDGIHAYCFEKAGATYIFQNGSFQEIVDSD